MNMTQYRDLHYEDSDMLNHFSNPIEENKDSDQLASDQKYEEDLLRQLQEGKINETQYNTLTKTNQKRESKVDENGFLVELENLNVNSTEEAQPEESQEQTPQYQFDSTY